MIYSVPYLLLISFYGIMALWYNQTKNLDSRPVNVLLCMLVTLLFWGFRGFCFYDWMSYYPMFLHAGIENFSDNITSMEPGFCLLITACKEIYDSYIFFAFVCSLINLALLSNFLLKHTDGHLQILRTVIHSWNNVTVNIINTFHLFWSISILFCLYDIQPDREG